MKFDEEVQILDRGTAFPQFYGNAIPFGDIHRTWNPMDLAYRWWHHMCTEAYELRVSRDDAITALMMGGEL